MHDDEPPDCEPESDDPDIGGEVDPEVGCEVGEPLPESAPSEPPEADTGDDGSEPVGPVGLLPEPEEPS